MKTIIKKIDFLTQAILILLIAVPAFLKIFELDEFLLVTFYLAPVLGIFQLSSAISWGILEKDKERGLYLLAAIAYILALWLGVTILDRIHIDWIASVLAFIAFLPPIGLALYYAWLSWKDAYQEKRNFASFWDM